MKYKHFLLLISFFISVGLSAQNNGFTLELSNRNDMAVGDAIEIDSSNDYAVLVPNAPPFGTPSQYSNSIYILRDSIVIDSIHLYGDSTWLEGLLQTQEGYIAYGIRHVSSNNWSLLFLELDKTFKPIDTTELLPFTGLNSISTLRSLRNRYLLCGSTSNSSASTSDGFVGFLTRNLDVDTIQESKGGSHYKRAYDVVSQNGNLVYLGNGYVDSINIGTQIISTDTNLTGATVYILPRYFEATVVQPSQTDSLFFVGGRAPARKISKSYRDLFIATWHMRTGLIDTTVFGSYDSSNLQASALNYSRDGKYLFFGGTVNYDIPIEYGHQQSKYLVAKFDLNLNLIWEKYIEVPNSYLVLHKIVPCSDGGVLLAGNKFAYVEHPSTAKRSVYIVKLDSSGNLTTNVSNPPKEPFQLAVYPNPATSHIRIESTSAREMQFELFNATGQLCRSLRFRENTTLSIENLSSGMYMYQVRDDYGDTQSGKVVIQR